MFLNGDVEEAYACWNMWAQQYLTLLSNTDFHSRGSDPCIKTGLLALPSIRELPTTHRPYIWSCLTALFLLSLNSISPPHASIPHAFAAHFFLTFCPQLTLLFPLFTWKAPLPIGYLSYVNLSSLIACVNSTRFINDAKLHGVLGLRTHGHLTGKRYTSSLRVNLRSLLLAFNRTDSSLRIDIKSTNYCNMLGTPFLLSMM